MNFSEILPLVRDGGSTALLAAAVVGGFKGWYVWRWQFDAAVATLAQMRQERDEWKNIALRGLTVAERVTSPITSG